MCQIRRMFFYFLVFFILIPVSTKAKKIGIFRFKPVGIENNITEAIDQLIESELISYGYTVVSANKIEEKLGEKVECYDKECAAEIGTKMNLDRIIFGSLTKIGEKYIVSAIVVEPQTGEIVFSDKVTSKTVEI